MITLHRDIFDGFIEVPHPECYGKYPHEDEAYYDEEDLIIFLIKEVVKLRKLLGKHNQSGKV